MQATRENGRAIKAVKPGIRKWLTGIAGIVGGLVVVAVALEFSLRAIGPPRDRFYVWPPGMHVTFEPYPRYLPGVEGTANVIISSDGVRGDEIGPDTDFKVLVLGGSSSECSYLDQAEAWPLRTGEWRYTLSRRDR